MTDFVDDLEQQLVAAARRRRKRRDRRAHWLRPRVLPRPGRLGAALAAVAVLALAVVGAKALIGGEPVGDDRAIGGPPVPPEAPFALTLPSPGTFTACTGLTPSSRPDSVEGVRDRLGVFRRPARRFSWKPDLPDLRRGDAALLPLTSYRERDLRGMRVQGVDLLLVPSGGVTRPHCGERRIDAPRAGACLVTRRGNFLATRCWTLEDIAAGKALTMVAPRDRVAGIVPDGVGTVELTRPGAKGGYEAAVRDNAFAIEVPGARRGVRLDVVMRGRGGPRVLFLNGTSRAGAERIAERELRASGYRFRTAAVGEGPDRDLARSRVYRTATGGRLAREAIEVGARLGISDVYDATDGIRTLAPEADVIVVVGADDRGRTGYAPLDGEGAEGEGYAPPPEHRGGGQ